VSDPLPVPTSGSPSTVCGAATAFRRSAGLSSGVRGRRSYNSQKKGPVSERVLGLVDTDKVEGVVIPEAIHYPVHRLIPRAGVTLPDRDVPA